MTATTANIDALPPAAPQLLTPRQVALRLQISVRAAAYLLARGEIKGVRIGRLWRVEASEVDAYIARLKSGTAA